MSTARTPSRSTSEQVVPGSSASTSNGTSRRRSHEEAFSDIQNPFANPDYPIKNFDEVYAKMRDSKTGLDVGDRTYQLLRYSKCFVGEQAVSWMTSNLKVDRDAAVTLGQRLMEAGIISHVTQSQPFSDDYFFFRFQEDVDSYVLNIKRIREHRIPTRPAVQVSRKLLTKLACLCEEYRKKYTASKSEEPPSSVNVTPNESGNGSAERLEPESGTKPCRLGTSHGTPVLQQAQSMSQKMAGLMNSPNFSNIMSSFTSPSLNQDPSTVTHSITASTDDDIDYSLLAKSKAFREYALDSTELQHVQLVGLSRDELMAFFVNLYNILCIHGYVVCGPPTNFWRRWIFFRYLSYRVAGLDMTLDDIEHGILRGNKRAPTNMLMQQLRPSDPKCQFVFTRRDERIHFVISAGTRSDPKVRILSGESLEDDLNEATEEFLSYSVKVNTELKKVTLPRIFLWYSDDFCTPELKLLRWVAKFLPKDSSHKLLGLIEDANG
eukprot:IDg9401t1